MNTPKARSLITGMNELNESPEGMMPGGDAGGPPAPRARKVPMRPGTDVGDALGFSPGERRPSGPPQRQRGPGGQGGPGGPGGEEGGMSSRERSALKDLIILDLLQALGGDPFFAMIAGVALKGDPITPEVVRHLMDEAPKYADKMSPEVNELMGKIAQMPMR